MEIWVSKIEKALETAAKLDPAVPRDLTEMLPNGTRHPFDRPLGPIKPRGEPSGIVMHKGEVVADYGDIATTEVTFSVSKSYLSVLAGIAVRDGLISDLDEPVGAQVKDGGFDSTHNSKITWRHLLHQTSEWEGELFGIPDWIDRGRVLTGSSGVVGGTAKATATDHRKSEEPGTWFEYNDVRVNRLSLALLRVFEEPLPDVLKREIMDPIGASDSWQWHGYETSWVDVNGRQIQSVSGGAHWGGGLWINSIDHALVGQLYLNQGSWHGKQLLPATWIKESLTPSPVNPAYGFLWWLNYKGSLSDVAGTDAYAARGAGGHAIFVWPSAEVVIVLRWCPDQKIIIDGILRAL
jgi:CubicO group peptidase (beta-lactamase class C family)